MRTAAKTMIELLGRAYCKTGGFFIMERTAGRIIRTRFFKRHAFIDYINDVNAIKQILNKAIRNQNASAPVIVIATRICE